MKPLTVVIIYSNSCVIWICYNSTVNAAENDLEDLIAFNNVVVYKLDVVTLRLSGGFWLEGELHVGYWNVIFLSCK